MLSLRFSFVWRSMAGALFAQQGYSPADIQAGKQLYGVNCTNCHGPNGDFVSGVDLGHGNFDELPPTMNWSPSWCKASRERPCRRRI